MKRLFCFFLCVFLIFLCGCQSSTDRQVGHASNTVHTPSQSESISSQGNSSLISSEESSSKESSAVISSQIISVSEDELSSSQTVSTPPVNIPLAETLLEQMSLKEKVAQLFIVCPEALNLTQDDKPRGGSITAINPYISDALTRYPVGGVILFSANVVNPSQLDALNFAFNMSRKIPLFLSVDEEGGNVARIAGNPSFGLTNHGSALYLKTPEKVSSVYNYIGAYLKNYKFNLDFAPVADIYSNNNNTVIGSRAFGKDAATVTALLPKAVKGISDNGIIPCIKHFPGHGDTVGDTHNGLVTLSKTWEQLLACEIIPFKASIENGADMIMASHITLPNVTKESVPTSLSKEMLTDKLRGELGFEGVIITDSLSMGAITKHYTSDKAALAAFNAGADILLMPQDFISAYNSILSAAKSGAVSEDRIDESVLRILKLKEKYKIIKE